MTHSDIMCSVRKINSSHDKFAPNDMGNENQNENERKPIYLLPIPCETLECFAGKIHSSLHEANEALQQRNEDLQQRNEDLQQLNAQLEERLGRALHEAGEARAQLVTLREQLGQVLGFNLMGTGA